MFNIKDGLDSNINHVPIHCSFRIAEPPAVSWKYPIWLYSADDSVSTDADPEQRRVRLNPLPQWSRLQLINIPLSPDKSAVKKLGLIRSCPDGKVARQLNYICQLDDNEI